MCDPWARHARICIGRNAGMMQTTAKRRDQLAGDPAAEQIWGIVATIVRAVDPFAIILFGSRARRNHRAASDVDLLVVQERLTTRQLCSALDHRRALADAPLSVDLVAATPARLAAAGATAAACCIGRR